MIVLNYASPPRHLVPSLGDVGPRRGSTLVDRVTHDVGFGVFDPPDGHYKGGMGPKHGHFGRLHLLKSTWSDFNELGCPENILKNLKNQQSN